MDDASEAGLLAELCTRVELALNELDLRGRRHRPIVEASERLAQLAILLAQWAPRMNLTGHREPEEIIDRLILDAAGLVGAVPELADSSSLADLGSGAGFPALPIAILCPSTEVTLVESRLKRHHFQREARRRLLLENVRPILGRAEEVTVERSDAVIAQAMAVPTEALGLMQPWAVSGGLLVLPAAEGAAAPQLPRALDGARVEGRSFRVPGRASRERLVWLVRLPAS